MTETVSTERLEEIATDKDNFYRAEIKAMAAELLASRTAKPLEAIIRDLVLWINTKSKHLPEKDRTGIQDYMRRMGIQGSVFRVATPPAPERKEVGGVAEALHHQIDEYWRIAWREGSEGRVHDNEDNDASRVRAEIDRLIAALSGEQG